MSIAMIKPIAVTGMPFYFDESLDKRLELMRGRIDTMWANGALSPQILQEIYEQAKIDELYHSNKIEGNSLTRGETEAVVIAGEKISGKPLRDQQEARNLFDALAYAQEIALNHERGISQSALRSIHAIVLRGIQSDAGKYRQQANKIAGSNFETPEPFLVHQHMTELSNYIRQETDLTIVHKSNPIFAAAAAHTWFVQIHPFSDGNGRVARALMNLILRRRGYPPCLITEEDRPRYIDALEEAWANGDLTALIELMYENVAEHLKNRDWLAGLQARLEHFELAQAQAEYASWREALAYLKTHFKHIIHNLGASPSNASWKFADYGALHIKKYAQLRDGGRAKKTWFFGFELRSGKRRARYVFFFAPALGSLKKRSPIALVPAKNTVDGYQRLYNLKQENLNAPDIFQIGFDLERRKFLAAGKSGLHERNPQNLVQQFLEQVIEVAERDFAS